MMNYKESKLRYRNLIGRRSGQIYGFFLLCAFVFLISVIGWLWEVEFIWCRMENL